jgi:parallel beta-helix repeat protein
MLTAPARKAAAWIGVLAALPALQYILSSRRPPPPELRVSQDIVVTSLADEGPGSLREAIFAAASAPARSRIRLPAGRLTLRTALPPIVNASGVVIEGTPNVTEIDGAAITSGAVLDIDAPNSIVTGVGITNAPGQGLIARRSGLLIRESRFLNSNDALHSVDGVDQLIVERSTFANNRTGVRIDSTRGRVAIRDNRFSGHEGAAVWVVRERPLNEPLAGEVIIARNRFERDRLSLVLANAVLTVENNEFVAARDTAVLLLGDGAVVRNNRVRNGTGVGLIADNADGVVIDGNEINHNHAIGLLLRSSSGAIVQGNRLYQNGYGMAFVFGGRSAAPNLGVSNTLLQHTYDGVIVIGASPVLRENRVMNGRLAGVRILDYYTGGGARTPAEPLLQRNHVEGNTTNEPLRGEYRTRDSRGSSR